MPEIQPCNLNPNSASERHALHPLRRLACPGRPACRLLASKPPRNPGHRLASTWKTLPTAGAAKSDAAAPEGWISADQAARPLAADWWRG